VLAGVLGAPMAVLGGAKVGGYLNTHSVTNYFLAGAVACGLARVAAAGRAIPRVVLLALLIGLGGAWLVNPLARAQVAPSLARIAAWTTNPQEQAFAVARRAPGTVLLPWNPLPSLLADERLWSNAIGAWDRALGGAPLSEAQWRAWLPPAAQWIAFRPPRGAFLLLPLPTATLLPEFTKPVDVPGLEGWTVLARP
jgi:hypothetical protein